MIGGPETAREQIMTKLLAPFLLLGGALCLASCASVDPGSTQARAAVPAEAGTPLHQVSDRLYTAGQPAPAQWADIRAAGVTTVINLRPAQEMAGRNEAAEVAAAGLEYHQLDVAGPQDISRAKAAQVQAWISDAPGPVLLHCASGNRAGALLALIAASDGMPAEDAVELGRLGGMTSMEAPVREVLGLPAADR